MTTLLKNRTYSLTVGDTTITGLDIAFEVHRSLKSEPNTCEITIYNLSKDQQSKLEIQKKVGATYTGAADTSTVAIPVNLSAGYDGENSLIFAGQLREASSKREGPDVITTLSSGDGETQHRAARVSASFGPKTSIDTVIKACAKALKVGTGNLSKITAAEFPQGGAVFPCGTVLSGNAADELRKIMRSVGWEYSIQNGALQILTRRQALQDTAILVSDDPNTGLITTPDVGSDGYVQFRVLMLPDLFPGRRVRLETEQVKGFFRVNQCDYSGDLAGDSWFVDVLGEPLVPVR